MIIEQKGDLLSVERGIIVHGCNAKGRMGSGVAKEVRNRIPAAYNAYMDAYKERKLKLGMAVVVCLTDGRYVINGITQEGYGRNKLIVYTDYDAVRAVFHTVNRLATQTGLPVHFPLIGCGYGNGDWDTVSAIIENECPDPVSKTLWIL